MTTMKMKMSKEDERRQKMARDGVPKRKRFCRFLSLPFQSSYSFRFEISSGIKRQKEQVEQNSDNRCVLACTCTHYYTFACICTRVAWSKVANLTRNVVNEELPAFSRSLNAWMPSPSLVLAWMPNPMIWVLPNNQNHAQKRDVIGCPKKRYLFTFLAQSRLLRTKIFLQ